MAIFPEGTRNKTEDPILPFKKGAFILAKHTGVPLVPLAILNTGALWPSGSFLPRPGRVKVAIGEPIAVGPRESLASVAERAGQILAGLYLELRGDGGKTSAAPGEDNQR
jgi:1-acyl-sn-glycerol-3-phosphate acyltransferase